MVSIIVCVILMVIMIVVIYFVSKRRKRTESVIKEMQLNNSIELTAHKQQHVSPKRNCLDNNGPSFIIPQPTSLNGEDCDIRMGEKCVDQEIIKEEQNEAMDEGAVTAEIGDDEFIVDDETKDI